MGVTQLSITMAVDDGYQNCILYFKNFIEISLNLSGLLFYAEMLPVKPERLLEQNLIARDYFINPMLQMMAWGKRLAHEASEWFARMSGTYFRSASCV